MKIKPLQLAAGAAGAYLAPNLVEMIAPKIAGIINAPSDPTKSDQYTAQQRWDYWKADNAWIHPASRIVVGIGAYYLAGKFL